MRKTPVLMSYIVVPPIEKRVIAGGDDGRYFETGIDDDANSGSSGEIDNWLNGQWFRFVNLGIPGGATIAEAYLEFSINVFTDGALTKIRAADEATPLNPGSVNDYETRVKTTATIDWDGPGDVGADKHTPELKTIIQELVDSYGAIDTILFFIENDGGDQDWINCKHFDGNVEADRPLLYIAR